MQLLSVSFLLAFTALAALSDGRYLVPLPDVTACTHGIARRMDDRAAAAPEDVPPRRAKTSARAGEAPQPRDTMCVRDAVCGAAARQLRQRLQREQLHLQPVPGGAR